MICILFSFGYAAKQPLLSITKLFSGIDIQRRPDSSFQIESESKVMP